MTDRFVVPRPSPEAQRAYAAALQVEPGTAESMLRAAYAIDFPARCRQEVEWALDKMAYHIDSQLGAESSRVMHGRWRNDYLATRFPAPEPEQRRGTPNIKPNQTERDASRDWCGSCHNSLLGAYVCVRNLGHLGECDMVAREGLPQPSAGKMCEGCIPYCGADCAGKPITPSAGERMGETCIDGGACHHSCTERCYRRLTCSPLSAYNGPWYYRDQVEAALSRVPTPSAGEEGHLCIECGGPRKNTPERLSFCDPCWEKRTPNQVHPTEPGYRWSPGAWRHIQTGQVLGVSAGETPTYQCSICKKHFQVTRGPRVSCTVLHAPGTCCHHFETEVVGARPEGSRDGRGELRQEDPPRCTACACPTCTNEREFVRASAMRVLHMRDSIRFGANPDHPSHRIANEAHEAELDAARKLINPKDSQ